MRKFLNRIFNKKTIVTVSRRTVGTLTAFIGLLGLSVIFLNPMSLVAPLLPLSIEGWLYIEQSYVQNLFNTILAQSSISIGVSFTSLFLSILLLRKGLKNSVVSFGRGLKASPRATIKAPMKFYNKTKVWRNWILEKVDYLQSESEKWRRTFQVLKSPYSF